MCNSTEQLAYVLNAYYEEQSSANKANACDFSGSATIKAAPSKTGQCSSLIAQTSNTGAGSASPGTSSSKSGSTSSGVATGLNIPGFDFGLLGIATWVSSAMLSGGVMLLL